ncbi:MAG TPA: PaaI family thioesterase [Acidimicrobiia bacterium]|nr:PaaI family thioesterase [Acidimicrobiia bacterium]
MTQSSSANDAATALLHSSMPLCETLGMRGIKSDPDHVEIALDWDASLCTVNGMMHGGAIMALADSAGAVVAFLNLPEGAVGTSTIESKTNFLGAVTGGEVRVVSRPLKVGGRTIVVESEVWSNDRLVAKVTQTQIVLTA